MLNFLCLACLATAGLLGMLLVALHARRLPPWWIAAVHGTVGLVGTALLVVVLRMSAPGKSDQFGIDAAVLLTLALISGAIPAAARLRRRPSSMLALGLHATFAIMGLVILLATL